MCGIAGFLSSENGHPGGDCRAIVRRMGDALVHRGPDSRGEWQDERGAVALAHRRLSIVDLSPEGHQPMISESARYVIAYNGEIYNFKELRGELEVAGARFRGHSDTEVILAAIEEWGLESALQRFIGMFAIALWDGQERTVRLVRDRLGIKPLYYGWVAGALVFGSELKALVRFPGFVRKVDRGALALFLRHSCVPAPYSIYEGIRKLLPGEVVEFRATAPTHISRKYRFWSAKEVAERGSRSSFAMTDREAISQLEELLLDSIGRRMIADVPLGAFLSGGIDSSCVVALMQSMSDRPVKTFSIGSFETAFDEARQAKEVASHIGTDHTEWYVSPADAMKVIPRLSELYDEPFSDASQIPTHLVAGLAREHVTVALSGDGGDELFGGYNRYVWGRSIWRKLGWLPPGARAQMAKVLTCVSPGTLDDWFSAMAGMLPERANVRLPGSKLHKLATALDAPDSHALYQRLVSNWQDPMSLVIGGAELPTVLTDAGQQADLNDVAARMMFMDLVTYLPDDILTKVDRATMGVSLEARVPLIDHRVVEFAAALPENMKFRGGVGKWILREVLYRHVPRQLIDRPKMGFGLPIGEWLRGPLKDWAAALLDPALLREQQFLDCAVVRQKWNEHQSGKRDWEYLLWDVLMFQAWLDSQAD